MEIIIWIYTFIWFITYSSNITTLSVTSSPSHSPLISALFLTLVFPIATAFNDTSSYTITCSSNEYCKDQILNCIDNMDCNIICNADSACHGATMYCPQNATCLISCMGRYTCQSTRIYADYSDKLHIMNISGSCTMCSSIIYCPNNASCIIAVELGKPESISATLRSMQIHAEAAQELIMNIPISYYILIHTHIYCPPYMEDTTGQVIQNCRINVDPTNGIDVYGTLSYLNVYTEHGLKQLAINPVRGSFDNIIFGDYGPTIYCYDSTESCSFRYINGKFQCIYPHNSSICNIDSPNPIEQYSSNYTMDAGRIYNGYPYAYRYYKCLDNATCYFNCLYKSGCFRAYLECPETATCIITVKGGGSNGLGETKVYCPNHMTDANNKTIQNCIINIHATGGDNQLQQSIIYADGGLNQVQIIDMDQSFDTAT